MWRFNAKNQYGGYVGYSSFVFFSKDYIYNKPTGNFPLPNAFYGMKYEMNDDDTSTLIHKNQIWKPSLTYSYDVYFDICEQEAVQ